MFKKMNLSGIVLAVFVIGVALKMYLESFYQSISDLTKRYCSGTKLNLYNNLSICVSPCVCPYAIYSLSFGLI